jgi:hypothetical protein
MRSTVDPGGAVPQVAAGEPRRRIDGRLVVLLVLIALSTRGMLAGSLDPVALRTWTTVFVAIVVQALPFLVLGNVGEWGDHGPGVAGGAGTAVAAVAAAGRSGGGAGRDGVARV